MIPTGSSPKEEDSSQGIAEEQENSSAGRREE